DLLEVLQELRIRIWKVGLDTKLSASWIFRTAESCARDVRRRNRRWQRPIAPVNAKHASPEISHLFAASVSGLPEDHQQYLELYLAGYSEREIATKLRMGRKSVRTRAAWTRRFLVRSQLYRRSTVQRGAATAGTAPITSVAAPQKAPRPAPQRPEGRESTVIEPWHRGAERRVKTLARVVTNPIRERRMFRPLA
ncbi:MAG TPA: hypothetical protein VMN82_06895, partial [Thermoanaerobaculia bacterium]|nr:hypothetical protein [Thermoanaerobaculia bacterium]